MTARTRLSASLAGPVFSEIVRVTRREPPWPLKR
jgi:hypothetical protein